MQKRSAMIIAGALVLALLSGVVSRDLTLTKPTPVRIVAAGASTATAPAPPPPPHEIERE